MKQFSKFVAGNKISGFLALQLALTLSAAVLLGDGLFFSRQMGQRPLIMLALILGFQLVLALLFLREIYLSSQQLLLERDKNEKHMAVAEAIIVGLDSQGLVNLVNAQACNVLGWSEEELLGIDWFETCLPEGARAVTRRVFDELMAGRADFYAKFENEIVCKSGEVIYFSWHNSFVLDDEGRRIGTLSSGQDITERHNVEVALQESEQRLSLHVQHTPLAYIEFDADFNVVEWNPAAERIFGYSREEIMTSPGAALIIPSSARPHVDQVMRDLLQGTGGTRSSNENRTKDGRSIICEWYNTPLINESDQVIGYASLAQDITVRSRAEKTLQESESKYRALAESTNTIPWVYNVDLGKYSYVAPRIEQFLGYPAESWIDHYSWLRCIHPEDAIWILDFCKMALDRNENHQYELRMITKDDRVVWVRDIVAINVNEEGQRQLMGVTIDITAQKEAELALKRSEQKFKRAVKDAPFPMMIHADDGEVIEINRVWSELTGYTHQDIRTIDRWTGLAYGEWAPSVREIIDQLFEIDGRMDEGEFTINTKSGEEAIWDFSSVPLGRLPDGRRLALSSASDITKSKHTEAALRESQALLIQVGKIALVGGWMIDLTSGRLTWTREVFEIHGLDQTFQPSLEKAVTFFAPSSRLVWQEAIDRATHEGRSFSHELELITAAGKQIWVNVLGQVQVEEGEPVAITGAMQDITERKRAEAEREELIAELEARNAEMERFAYTVSHDLKAPLISIRGFLGWLEKDATEGNLDKLKGDIDFIRNASDKMYSLLNDLLELSRIGRQANPPESVCLKQLVEETTLLLRSQLTGSGVEVLIDPELPTVWGDRPRLREVIQNLLENASKYMGDQSQPQVEIGVRPGGHDPVIYVKDNGMGISPAYHEKIFGLFERLDATGEGTGVGLALVKRIVEVHQGRIWVESKGPGSGSTFCFTIPDNGHHDPTVAAA